MTKQLTPITLAELRVIESTPGTPESGSVAVYAKTGEQGLYIKNDLGAETFLAPDGAATPESPTFIATTTDDTPTALTTDGLALGADNTIPIAENSSAAIEILLTGKQAGSGNSGAWRILFGVSRNGSADPVVDSASVFPIEAGDTLGVNLTSSWIQVDTTNDSVYVQVTGIAATTINWTAIRTIVGQAGAVQPDSTDYEVITTDDTPTALTTDGFPLGSGNTLALAENSSVAVQVLLTAKQQGSGNSGAWLIVFGASRNGTADPVVDTASVIPFEAGETLGVNLTQSWVKVDATNDSVYLEVIGVAATSIKWTAKATIVEAID